MKTKKKIPTHAETVSQSPGVILCALIGGGIGLALTVMATMISPLALLGLEAPNAMATQAAAFCIFLGGASGAAVAAKRCKTAPMAAGLISAAIMALPILLVSFFITGEVSWLNIAVMTASLVISALIGSVCVTKAGTSRKRNMKRALKRR